jgi:diaminohydroxyphosphoribosylaminopyrimidine deaminase/5-amino-6-(5-phosphoribosylamino)uracil reductase
VKDDAFWMAQAVLAARQGRTAPNPRVGAVIVSPTGELISTGFHLRAGAPHAEPDAISKAKTSLRGATLYVTLEPCNHHGRTPPCSEAVIQAGFSRVVIGYLDPAPHEPGSVQRMQNAGITVESGVLEAECRALVADFEKHIRTGLPYVHLKAAVTLDGKMATRTGDSKWITGEAARAETHRMRDLSDACAVGVETLLADDPALTVRHVAGKDPIRVVFDTTLRTPVEAKVLADGAPCWILHGEAALEERRAALTQAGALLLELPTDKDGRLDLNAALKALGERGVMRLLVEGGGVLHGALLDGAHADFVSVFVAPIIVGDREAKGFAAGRGTTHMAEGWRLRDPAVRSLGPDVLIEGTPQRGEPCSPD